MKNTTNTNSTTLNKVYSNLIDYVTLIQKKETPGKTNWITNFVAQCEKGESDFAHVYKKLEEGLIVQFGFKMTIEAILPEIIWSNNLDAFYE